MPKVKLEIPYLLDLPQPPKVVDDALWHWKEYLRFLPKAGPKVPTMCAGIEREYHHITRKLQAQYHDNEPNEALMYDWRIGAAMEKYIHELSDIRRDIVTGRHHNNTPVPVMVGWFKSYKPEEREARFTQELRSAYLSLAGKLCPTQ